MVRAVSGWSAPFEKCSRLERSVVGPCWLRLARQLFGGQLEFLEVLHLTSSNLSDPVSIAYHFHHEQTPVSELQVWPNFRFRQYRSDWLIPPEDSAAFVPRLSDPPITLLRLCCCS